MAKASFSMKIFKEIRSKFDRLGKFQLECITYTYKSNRLLALLSKWLVFLFKQITVRYPCVTFYCEACFNRMLRFYSYQK